MWCAPSDRGKAQVTVLLAKKIIPQLLIVEQADTQDTTPYWQTFPDQIEFWASFDKDPNSWYELPNDRFQGRELAAAQALPHGFIMLGRWHYELHHRNRAQAFRISVDQPTNLVSFRVNSNHGNADQVCLHKLRLYGTPEQPDDHYRGSKMYDEDPEEVQK